MSYPCRVDGDAAAAAVDDTGLAAAGRTLPYVDIDEVAVEGHTVRLVTAGGATVVVDHLGRLHDRFVTTFTEAWRRARRAALLQWTGDAPIDEYEARDGEEPVSVVLFPDGLTVERRHGAPATAPFALVDDVVREGYAITLVLRAGLAPVVVRGLGRRTDEFLLDLERARSGLAARTAAAYADLDPALSGYSAPDGWALTRLQAGGYWGALRAAVAGARAAEVDALERLAGGELRLGVKAQARGESMPFALAPANGKVAVEGTSETEARATFVFATDDVDRLNAVLLLISFRREAISLPEDRLGRWAVAVRTLDIVRWARGALVARIVHNDQWEANLTSAMA